MHSHPRLIVALCVTTLAFRPASAISPRLTPRRSPQGVATSAGLNGLYAAAMREVNASRSIRSSISMARAPSKLLSGTATQVSERYWGWCGWYPCRKTRTVTKWYYSNLRVNQSAYAFYCTYDACEGDGNKHHWSGACLGFGSNTCYWSGYRDSRLSDQGRCNYINDPVTPRC